MSKLKQAERDKLPASAFCGPNRTYPILDADDVSSAARLLGRAPESSQADIRSCVIGKAKAHGWPLPKTWQTADHANGGTCPLPTSVAFSATGVRVDGDDVIRRGKIFEAGHFDDKSFSLSPEEMWLAVQSFEPCPIDIEHTDSVLSHKLGKLEAVEQSPDGFVLFGDVRLPKWLDDLLGDDERKVSCSWDRETKTLTGLSLVRNPRIADAALMAAFAGARHSAADQADMQTVHDIARRQGAACDDDEGSDTVPGDINEQVGMFARFQRWLATQQPRTPVPVVFSGPSAGGSADPEKEELRVQLALLQAQQINDRAAAFAAEQVGASKALPAQRDALIAAYSIAAADDASSGHASFAAGKLGRVDALAAIFANAPAHSLTRELAPVRPDSQVLLGNAMATPKAVDEPVTAMSPERFAQLMNMTPQGAQALRDIASRKPYVEQKG